MAAKRNPEREWPASSIEIWPISKIIPSPENPRTHPPAQIRLLAEVMRKQGVTMPILVDETGIIIKGHGRHMAALENGFSKYPVAVAKGWSEEDKRAARISDNQIGLLSGWDRDLLRGQISGLQSVGFDVALLGFGEAELVSFTKLPGPPAEFKAIGESLPTEYCCPRCAYKWSGSPAPGKAAEAKEAARPARRSRK